MADEPSGGGEKSFEATPQKLEKARKKGDIPRSMDVSPAAVILGLFLAFNTMGKDILDTAFPPLRRFLSDPDLLGSALLGSGVGHAWGDFSIAFLKGTAFLFALPFLASLIAFGAQRAIIFSPQKLKPKLSRLSPIENAKNKFGTSGLVQFLKNLTKASAVSVGLLYFLNSQWDVFFGLISGEASQIVYQLGKTIVSLTLIALAIFSSIALVDLLWQRYHHGQKMRMTHQEVRDEHKQSEGDPHLKAERRQKAQDLAANHMLRDVPNADVIVVNPSHYAVALRWSRNSGEAPICVAKGTDAIAARIREIADQNTVPIYRDPPTARALFASTEIGAEIDPSHYRAIAVAIRFAEQMQRKASWTR